MIIVLILSVLVILYFINCSNNVIMTNKYKTVGVKTGKYKTIYNNGIPDPK